MRLVVFFLFIFYSFVLIGASSIGLLFWETLTPTSGFLNWTQCEGYDERYSCALFEVPLDWNDPSAGKGQLGVVKLAASKIRIGTLFSNPGGPGRSGIDHVLWLGKTISSYAGGAYDVVSWDPRGVGQVTFPGAITCFSSIYEYNAYWNNSIVAASDVRGSFTDQNDIAHLYANNDNLWTRINGLGAQCTSTGMGEYLPYVGTAAGARDMVALANAIDGEDIPINYWGFSYGTTIGSFFVNMFPDRVGRVAIDGCQDPEYYSVLRSDLDYQTTVSSADAVFDGFADACSAAGPSRCALADSRVKGGKTIRIWVQDLIDLAYNLVQRGVLDPGSSTSIRSQLYHTLYNPHRWAQFANEDLVWIWGNLTHAAQEGILRRDLSEQLRGRRTFYSDTPPDHTMEAIVCGDSVDPGDVTTKMVLDEYLRVSHEVSGMFGPMPLQPSHKCHAWPVRAVERFAGPFNHTLAKPILVIGNTADPATPFANARAVANAFGESALLIRQDGFGHTSLVQKSRCMTELLRSFWVNGTYPQGEEIVCPVDDTDELFPSGASSPPYPAPTLTHLPSSSITVFPASSSIAESRTTMGVADTSTTLSNGLMDPEDAQEDQTRSATAEQRRISASAISVGMVLLLGIIVIPWLFWSRRRTVTSVEYIPIPQTPTLPRRPMSWFDYWR